MTIDIEFEDPNAISEADYDELSISFPGADKFMLSSDGSGLHVPANFKTKVVVPKQVD